MKLRSLHLTNVRRFAGQTALLDEIGDGITVFSAPNESGKSTFFDALHALFFQPYTSQNREVKSLQPHSGGAVTVSAEIESRDHQYRLEKTWLSRKSAKVTDCETDRLLAQDDEAEAWIERLIVGGLGGPAGLLWVRQGVTALEPSGTSASEKREWQTALAARRDLMSTLAGEIDLMTGGRRMDQVLATCRTALGELATSTGRPKAGGPWRRAEEEAEGLCERRDVLAAQVTELSGALEERRRVEAERSRLDDPEERAEREVALRKAHEAMAAAEAHTEKLEAAEREVKIAGLEHRAAELTFRELTDLDTALAKAKDAARRASEEEEVGRERHTARLAEEAVATTAFETSEARVRELREAHTRAQRAMMARLAAERVGEMRARLGEAEACGKRLAEARAQIEATQVDDTRLARFEDLSGRVTEAKALRDALAVTVTPGYDGDLKIGLEGTDLPDREPQVIHGRARLQLPGIGGLEIDTGGRESTEDARNACESVERELRLALEKAGVSSLTEARQLHVAWRKAQDAAAHSTGLLASLAPDGVEKLRENVASLELSAAAEEDVDAGDPEALSRQLQDAEGDLHSARAALDAARKPLIEADKALSGLQTAHRLARETLDAARAAIGTAADHAKRKDGAAGRIARATDALRKAEDLRDALAAAAPDMETLRAEISKAEGAVRGAADRIRNLSDRILELDGLIRARAEDGVEESLAEVSGRIEEAKARTARYAREVSALQRLQTALEDARHAARDAYFEPVKAELLPLLSLLHDQADIRLDDSTLLPVALTREGQEEDISILSGGTAEQVAILTRLAFARLFDRSGHNVPVILDDALIHSDDDRIERMFTALHRVAGDQQILVFTCRQRAFSRLGGSEAQFAISLT